MALSFVQYTGDGSTTTFAVPFPYIAQSHIQVKVDGVLKTASTDYTFPTTSTLQFTTAPLNGLIVEIRRVTPRTNRLVDFQDASTLTEAILDQDSNQNFFVAQEAFDLADSNIKLTPDNTFDAEGLRIKNLGAPTLPTDAVRVQDLTEDAGSVQLRVDLNETVDVTKGAALVPTAVRRIGTIADLRALPVPTSQVSVNLLGYYTPGDGGGGSFYWDAASTAADNGGTVILPTGYTGSGRWIRYDLRHRTIRHKGFPYDTLIIADGATTDGLHRHFGQIAEGVEGRLHLVYGRSPTHGLTAGQTTWYRYSDDGGSTWSSEIEAIPADANADQRNMSMCVTSSGRIVLIYAKVLVPSAAPTVFRVRHSDDNGKTWRQGDDITSVPYTYVRAYGRIKLIPGSADGGYKLAFTPYYRSSDTPTYRVATWYSMDDGASWTEGAPIVDDASGQTECEMVAVNGNLWFAVTRSGSGLTLYKTTNAGVSWTSLGIVPLTSSDSQVAPTLDKFERDGAWFLVMGYCDRVTDTMKFRVAAVAAATISADAFGSEIITATDMENASGYHCTVTNPEGSLYVEGGMGYVVFKEYVGQPYTQVRFVRADLLALVAKTATTFYIVAGEITIPGNSLERIITVKTEGGAATDEIHTINGGRWGDVYVFQGSQTTNTEDTIFRSGVGNLDLVSDFRANTSDSRLVMVKTGNKWLEISRTNDNVTTTPALVIAADAVTVPSSRVVAAYLIDTEAAAATDNLTTINGGLEGQIIVLMSATSSRDVTIAEGGNIVLDVAGNFTMSNSADTMSLVHRANLWYEISRSDNA